MGMLGGGFGVRLGSDPPGGSYPRPRTNKNGYHLHLWPNDNGYHLQLNANDNYFHL